MEGRNQQRQKKSPLLNKSSSQTSIDDLPVGILTHILSFLPTTTAVRTSAVAPQWRNLWHSVPVVNFSMVEFHEREGREEECSIRHTRHLFAGMLTQYLLQRPRDSAIQKFNLFISYRNHNHVRSYVGSWLRFLIGAKVEELKLDFDAFRRFNSNSDAEPDEYEVSDDAEEDNPIFSPYAFHYSDLVNSSVRVLKLTYCGLCMPRNPLPIKISSLREMHLEDVFGKQNEVTHLVASCVNLEILSVERVQFVKYWKIESQSLKHFKFSNKFDRESMHRRNSVEICAPNLESMCLWHAYDAKCDVKDTSHLVVADVKFPGRHWSEFARWANLVRCLGGVERLTIQNMWIWSPENLLEDQRSENLTKSVKEVISETFVFRNLKHLNLLTGYTVYDILNLEILLGRCPQLETMVLDNKYESAGLCLTTGKYYLKDVTDLSLVLQIPRLRLVEMKKFKKTENELFFVGLLKKHGAVLDKIVAYPKRMNRKSSPSFVL